MAKTINPATDEVVCEYPEMSNDEVISKINQSNAAFSSWRRTAFAERSAKLKKAAEILRTKKNDLARLMAVEMGKPVKQGQGETEKCAWVCDFYAENAESFLAPEKIETDASKSYVAFEPLGTLFAIMPWNFPLWQVFRAAAPCLMAGNVMLLKHASNVTGSALEIEKIFTEAGFPDGTFQTLIVDTKNVRAIIENPLVKAVTLTGSVPAGRAVGEAAGRALKKTVLELGGSDPYLILEDADLDAAAASCATSRMINGGQSCVAAKRFLVVKSVREAFEKKLAERLSAIKPGDPLKEETALGPMARKDLRDELHEQVQKSISMGARCLTGGTIPEGKGAFYPATVLTDVKEGMPVYGEETFGPVAAVIEVEDEKEAVRIANDSVFGLGSAVFTRDVKRGERIAHKELEAGASFVNGFVKSDPRLPFGGIKESGYGRELASFGIREFVNAKTVYIS